MSYFSLQQEQYERDALFEERDFDVNGVMDDDGNDNNIDKENLDDTNHASSSSSSSLLGMTSLQLRRLRMKMRNVSRVIVELPGTVRHFFYALMEMLKNPSKFIDFVLEVWQRLKNTPLFVFYSYLWRNRKFHFFMNVFVSYLLPMILEALPWYFSRRKIGQKLRSDRNTIQNQMIAGKQLTLTLARNYVLYTVLYSLLENLERHLNDRVTLMNRLIVKRLVLEKILYSEIWAFGEYQGRELEYRISNEIQMTLRLFSNIIPKLFSSCYAIYQESRDLYANRSRIDLLSVGLPMCSMLVWKCVDWTKTQVMGRRKMTTVVSTPKVSELFTNVMDGLTDIQLNNLQSKELRYYDEIVSSEFSHWEDLRMFANRAYNTFTRRGVFDFLSEVYVAALVMKKKGMDFEQYRKVQIDIDHLVKLIRRAGSYVMQTKRTVERQNRVVELMRLPNFQDEVKHAAPITVKHFERLVIEDIAFSYARRITATSRFALNFQGRIMFEANKIYAIIGENRSGKSTLVNLLTKLYVPHSGTIMFNNVDYSSIERGSLRNLISYVSQKPYIFPGTVIENIRVGNPNATDNDVIRAAKLAGLFLYDEKLSSDRKRKIKGSGGAGDSNTNLNTLADTATSVGAVDEAPLLQVSHQETEVAEPIGAQMRVHVESGVEHCGAALVESQAQTTIVNINDKQTLEGTVRDDDGDDEDVDGPATEEQTELTVAVASTAHGTQSSSSVSTGTNSTGTITSTSTTSTTTTTTTTTTATTTTTTTNKKKISRKRALKILSQPTHARGANISGGFAQSIALARVFLRKDAKIVILDESMSAMDPIKKRRNIMPNLMQFIKENQMTLLLITHDMSCLSSVDHIVMLETGRLVCQGTHDQLMEQNEQKYMQMLGMVPSL